MPTFGYSITLSDRALQLPARRPLHSGLLARIIGPAPATRFRRRRLAVDVTDIIDPLNDAQRAAVTAPDRPTLVLAGAGSGKTRVLVHRIAWVIRVNGVAAQHVLAVTFTNKAAAEMRDRIERLLGFPTRNLWIGTFHGLAHRLLRIHSAEAGLAGRLPDHGFRRPAPDDPPDAARARGRRERVGAERDPVVHQRAERRGPAAEGPEGRGQRGPAADDRPLRALREALRGRVGRRLRRAAAPLARAAARQRGAAAPIPRALQARARRRVPGHERDPVPLAQAARGARPACRSSSATTISRSIAGAARASRICSASSRTSRARSSCGSSRTTARPRTS